MMRTVESLTRMQLRKELFKLRGMFVRARAMVDEDGAAGSPAEWMDERADEIRTELRKRRSKRRS